MAYEWLRDVIAFIGISLIAGGCYLVYVPAALIVPGLILLYLGVWHGPSRAP